MAHLDPEAGTWTGTDAPLGIPPDTLQIIKQYRDAVVSVTDTLSTLPWLTRYDHKFPPTAWDCLESAMEDLNLAHRILNRTLAKAEAAQKKATRKSRAKPKTAKPAGAD